MRALNSVIILFAALIITIAFVFEYFTSASDEAGKLNEATLLALELKQQDTLLNENALMVAGFKLVHFDTVAQNSRALFETAQRLQDSISSLREAEQFNLQNQISALTGTIEYRIDQMERLKSRAALARNSSNFLLTTLRSDARAFGESGSFLALKALNEIQGFKIFPTQERRENTFKAIEAFKANGAESGESDAFKNIVRHMQVSFDATVGFSVLLNDMFSQASQQQISLLINDLGNIDARRQQQSTFLVSVLMGLAALICITLIYSLMRWNQARIRALKASRLVEDALESLSEGFAFFDAQNKLVFWNSTFRAMYQSFGDRLKIGIDLDKFREIKKDVGFAHQIIERDDGTRLEKTRDGRWLLCSNKTIKSGGRALVRVDLTDQKKAEEKLYLAGEVFRSASEAMMVTDKNDKIIMVNGAFSRITGFSEQEVLGRTPQILNSGLHNQEFFKDMFESLKENGTWSGEIWNRRKSGESFAEWLSITTIYDETTGEPLQRICLFTDITQLKKSEERLHYQANYDSLTNLPNRNMFSDGLVQSLKNAREKNKRLALLSIDLDNFGQVNETLGHYIGDKLLRKVAERLENFFASTDIIARFSGDQFLILCHDTGRNLFIEKKLDELLNAFSQPFDLSGNTVYSTISVGVTLFPDDAGSVDELLQNADAATFKAKQIGKNTYCFFQPEMNVRAQERQEIETAMHAALAQNHFVVHYQPIVDPHTQTVVSTEALVRWQDPKNGLIPPGKFIPVAEDSGLIVPLGEWILKQACRDAANWYKERDYNLGVSVNLSSRQFQRSDIFKLVRETLIETGLPAQKLTLEITESLLVDDQEYVLGVLRKIRDLGVLLSIDDFGTGYSSLSYLKQFPITTLKIDRSFINGVLSNAEDAALTEAILSMAQSLKLKVVAEGVESEGQVVFLRERECDLIQGFHYSKPLALEDLMKRFENGELDI